MIRLSTCLAAAAHLSAGFPVAAQQARPDTPTRASNLSRTPHGPSMAGSPWTRASYEALLDSASGNNIPAQPLARVDLANRVSTLIELGRCTDARNEAREAGDRQMALRARQLCRTDRDPASQPT